MWGRGRKFLLFFFSPFLKIYNIDNQTELAEHELSSWSSVEVKFSPGEDQILSCHDHYIKVSLKCHH